ncbi:hypothetical protein F5880DRAFT_1617582 [Lentinula raphanica]|nr:hypothetical protein F5880DRAFT_1617582 [Lentinula raphanica]
MFFFRPSHDLSLGLTFLATLALDTTGMYYASAAPSGNYYHHVEPTHYHSPYQSGIISFSTEAGSFPPHAELSEQPLSGNDQSDYYTRMVVNVVKQELLEPPSPLPRSVIDDLRIEGTARLFFRENDTSYYLPFHVRILPDSNSRFMDGYLVIQPTDHGDTSPMARHEAVLELVASVYQGEPMNPEARFIIHRHQSRM